MEMTPVWRRRLKITFLSITLAVGAFVGLAFLVLRHSYPPEPALSGTIEHGALQHDGRKRTWIAYLPAKTTPSPALVIVLHASMGSGAKAREDFGYDFDRLADRNGFIAVYPQGYDGHWNDCRVKGPFAAKRENIDDVGFLHALVDAMVKDHGIDRSRIFVAGVSNGGAMVLRLALQTPEFARAYAAVISSVPTPENMAPTPKNQPVSVLLMNGTGDPFVPWDGGDVVLYGVWGNRGPVLSAQGSVDYFRKLDGLDGAPRITHFPDRDPGDGTTVTSASWSAPGKRNVAFYTVEGGGHGVPHPAMHGPLLLGRSNRDIHAADEIWQFFQAAP
jgi:polyhydroxybutyrate depolymerase